MISIDIGVFAHNEADGIAAMLDDCLAQTIFTDAGLDLRLLVLANGCSDATADVSRSVLARHKGPGLEVADLREGGKSRTWNRFVHELSRPGADYLLFLDADIAMPDPDTLARLLRFIVDREHVVASPSRPVKDLERTTRPLTPVEKLIAASAGGLDDWKTAICGQLYIARTSAMRTIWLPVGLPVEDGFIRAMILTENFSKDEDLRRIDADDGVWHVYESERTLSALIRHQVRIIIGSAINTLIFRRLEEEPKARRGALMAEAAKDDDWLGALIRKRLPSMPYGWVPFHYLVKRLNHFSFAPRRAAVVLAGFGFDALVYCLAQIRMARGTGAHFW